jgi:chitinase
MMGDSARVAAMQTCTNSAHMNQFVSTIANFVNTNAYDGFDLDWEAGIIDSQWQSLVQNLHIALPGKTISVAVTVTERFDVAAVQSSLDQANIMNYDRDSGLYSGNWATDTWYNSALLAGGDTNHPTAEMDVQYYTGAGVAPGKIGIGLPFYERIKQGCRAGYLNGSPCSLNVTDPGQTYATGDATTNPRTAINYNDLLNSVYWSGGTKIWDAKHGSQYLQYNAGGNQAFVPYTGVEQIQAAVNFVNTNNLGGIMVYELSGEYVSSAAGDARYPLSVALSNASGGATAPVIMTTSPLARSTVGTFYSASVSATGTTPMAWTLAIYVPPGYRFDDSKSAAAVNLADINLEGSVLRARVKFDGPATQVKWSVAFLKS